MMSQGALQYDIQDQNRLFIKLCNFNSKFLKNYRLNMKKAKKCPSPNITPIIPGMQTCLQLQPFTPPKRISIIIIIYIYIQINIKSMNECHYCLSFKQKIQNNMARCCIKKCSKCYCLECINKFFNPQFDMHKYKKQTWICFYCQKKCQCDKCSNSDLADKRMRKRLIKANYKDNNDDLNQLNMKENYLLKSNENIPENQVIQHRIDDVQPVIKRQDPNRRLEKELCQRISVLKREQTQNIAIYKAHEVEHQLKYYNFLLRQFQPQKETPQKINTTVFKTRLEEMIAKALREREDVNDFQTIND